MLPRLVVDGRQFNPDQMNAVMNALITTPIDRRHPLLVGMRENMPRPLLDEFALALFTQWMRDGAENKQKWAMGACGHLGGDGCVLELSPKIRVWPGESQHQRAVFGLQCLRAIGTKTALMELASIARKLKFKGLKARAGECVEAIASDLGLSRDELEDRVVPDCGLDEQGRREFPFGDRSFAFVLGGDLKPMVRGEDGKVRPNLPKPGKKDDAEVANASVAEWKTIKKQIKEVATAQAARLEQAMIVGRRWTKEDFETLLVRQPLVTHLVQKLLWAAYEPGQGGSRKTPLRTLFRVTEERDYADAADETLTLPDDCEIAVPHALELSDAERSEWGQIFGDYELIEPFPQLGREVYELSADETKSDSLERFHGLALPAPTLVFGLEKLGYVRGEAMDAGCFDEESKQYPAANVTVVVQWEGAVGMGWIEASETLTVESVRFFAKMRKPSGYGWDQDKPMPLSKVPPVVLSETIADLELLRTKATG